ncbi:hypothetical protein G4B88_007056 [Cannabis sativa]|uniref:Uncharacterized protein n=1 Tax=Cannabis sativa TaxID=3483 RepID=A0A7J6FNU0_CANSA|nr:hypothetical protein G4B88_007056 [Cannabis sativa]
MGGKIPALIFRGGIPPVINVIRRTPDLSGKDDAKEAAFAVYGVQPSTSHSTARFCSNKTNAENEGTRSHSLSFGIFCLEFEVPRTLKLPNVWFTTLIHGVCFCSFLFKLCIFYDKQELHCNHVKVKKITYGKVRI